MSDVKIICHMIASVDGRILTGRWDLPEDYDVGSLYEETAAHFGGEGWIVGRTTMAEYAPEVVQEQAAQVLLPEPADRPSFKGKIEEDQLLALVFDRSGKLHYKDSTLPTGEHLVAVLGDRVPDSYLQELQQSGVSYVLQHGGDEGIAGALAKVKELFPHVQTLLLEGGSVINGAFLNQHLINELSLVMCPAFDGNAVVPSFFGYTGGDKNAVPGKGLDVAISDCKAYNDGTVWLHYIVTEQE